MASACENCLKLKADLTAHQAVVRELAEILHQMPCLDNVAHTRCSKCAALAHPLVVAARTEGRG